MIFITLLSGGIFLSGQTAEEVDSSKGELYLRIKNVNFFKNNEYFNPISASEFELSSSIPVYADKSQWIEGYTLPGFFLQPELIYKPSAILTLRGGVHLLWYYGSENFTQIRPVISTSLNISENTVFTLGALSGSDTHKMFDPHFYSERLYTNYLENGFQFTHKNDRFFTDTWLSWENYIVKDDGNRESFTFGESFSYTSPLIADFIQIEIPVQIEFKHFGGQITDFPERVETFFNTAAGVRMNFDIAEKKYGVAGVEYLYFINSVVPQRELYTINNGKGTWLRFHYNYKALYVGAAIWNATNFYAPNGNPIYASIIDYASDYVIPDRKVITNSIFINLLPQSNLELRIGLETYYNACIKKMDYAYTLHLNFDKLFKLADIRNSSSTSRR